MSIKHGGSVPAGNNVLRGQVDASLAANLPESPATGDRWTISVAGTFQNDALISPASYSFTVNDGIEWDGTNWLARESGSDVWITGGTITGITDLAVADGGTGASDATNARTNLDVYSTTQTDSAIDIDIATHAALTQTHGISAFGSTLVDDADAATAQSTLGLASTITKVAQQDATGDIATQTYTIQLTDHGKTLFFTYAGAVTITLPASIGDTVHVTCVVVDAAGSLAFVDDTTSTIVSKGSLFSVTDQYGVATAVHRGSNAWYLFGNLA
jgi:hypothetical protein